MRLSMISLVAALAAAFALGRVSIPWTASAATSGHVYTGFPGDVFRVPSAATRCTVTTEAGAVAILCGHAPSARYAVAFFKDNLFVYRNGHPDNPVFSAHGKP